MDSGSQSILTAGLARGEAVHLFPTGIRRVLLVNPPSVAENDFRLDMARDRRYWSYPPNGIATLAGNLKASGYQADICDLNAYILKHSLSPWSCDFRYGDWRDYLEAAVKMSLPDIVGVSVMFTMQHGPLVEIVRECGRHRKPVIVGGVHPTNAREFILNDCPDIDILGLYECDKALPIFFDAVNGKRDWSEVGQIVVRTGAGPVELGGERMSPNTEDLVAPDYCGIDLGVYESMGQVGTYGFLRDRDRKASSVLSTRGCRAKCSFCSVRHFNGPGVRTREVQSVLDEIKSLYENHGIRHITWLDDDLLSGKRRALALFKGMAEMSLDITWDASNGLIAAAIDEEILDAMVESGCVGFNLGVESGSPEILRSVHKPGTVERFLRCAELLKKYPQLFVKGFWIIGFMKETLRQIKQSVELSIAMGLDWSAIQLLQPLASTELFQNMADQGFLQDGMNTEGRGFTAGVFSSLNQRTREEAEKVKAADFFDILAESDLDTVPSKESLPDLWFLVDFKMNYEPIYNMIHPVKLRHRRLMLKDVADRITKDNPLANYFLGLVEEKLGDLGEASRRREIAGTYLGQSAYWQSRFSTLHLI